MNYTSLYEQVVDNRRQNPLIFGYREIHHIIPTSLGGSNDEDNLIHLTAREHFVCHYLLAKMYREGSFEWHKMNHAFMMMKCTSKNQKRYFNSKLYESLRQNFSMVMSKSQQGKNSSQYGTCWITHLERKICKKIKLVELDTHLLDGWVKKRIINWDAKPPENPCSVCGQMYVGYAKTCSQTCGRETAREKRNQLSQFEDQLNNMIDDYKNGTSIYKCLRNAGFCGTGAGHGRLKQELIKQNLIGL